MEHTINDCTVHVQEFSRCDPVAPIPEVGNLCMLVWHVYFAQAMAQEMEKNIINMDNFNCNVLEY